MYIRCKDVIIDDDKEKQDSEVMSSPQLKTTSRKGNLSNAQVTPRQTKPSIARYGSWKKIVCIRLFYCITSN